MIAQGAERREVSDQAKHHDGEDEEPPLKRSRTSPENPVSSFLETYFKWHNHLMQLMILLSI